MNYHHAFLILHLVAATVWVGGHIVIATTYLPVAVKQNDPAVILNFESRYERLGMSSLLILVATGIVMAFDFGVYPDQWFHFDSPVENVVSAKLSLLLLTVLFAMSARFWAIPRLRSGMGIRPMAAHIISVTVIGIAMLVLGSFMRYGGI